MKAPLGLIAASSAVLLLAGCGGDGNQRADTIQDKPTKQNEQPKAAGKALTEAQLEAALLEVADMPTGFSAEQADHADDASGYDDECAKKFDEIDKAGEAKKVAKAERDFSQGGLTGAFVSQALASYKTDDDARDVIDNMRKFFQDCQEFTDTDKDGTKTAVTLAALSFPKVGDDTYALLAKGKSDDVEIAFHIVVSRVGQNAQLVANGSLGGPDAKITEQVVRTGITKLSKAG